MINKEDVKHIAKLARLGLEDEEVAKLEKELSAILDYEEQLRKVNVDGVEPTSHSVVVENVFRKDETGKKEDGLADELIKAAPDRKERHLKVKAVF